MPRAAPNRRQGESRNAARRRAKAAGLCQRCGRKKNTSGPLCGGCIGKATRRDGPRRDDWQ